MIKQVPHKNYDNLELLNEVLMDLKPQGFQNHSWGNDTCPCVGWIDGGIAIKVFVDYKSTDLRENEDWTTFHVTYENDAFYNTDEYYQYVDTNDYKTMIEAAKGYINKAKKGMTFV